MNRSIPISHRRIYGYILQMFYHTKNTWPGLISNLYFPVIVMIMWGFITDFFKDHSERVAAATILFIGASVLSEVFGRIYTGMAGLFLHDIRGRSLTSLMTTPLQLKEMLIAMWIMGFVRNFIFALPAFFLAFYFFDVNLMDLGPYLYLLIFNLTLLGWWMGTWMITLSLKEGPIMHRVVYGSFALMTVINCVQFPPDTLPLIFKWIALALPGTYIFEGFRAVVVGKMNGLHQIGIATGLNIFYIIIMFRLFFTSFRNAARSGRTITLGE